MSIITLFLIMLVHWLADFILQSDKMAKYKSTNNTWLTIHVLVYSLVTMFGFEIITLGSDTSVLAFGPFFGLVFITHWITDYITSRVNSYYYKKEEIHNFFVMVGFDQYLHLVQLVVIYSITSDKGFSF